MSDKCPHCDSGDHKQQPHLYWKCGTSKGNPKYRTYGCWRVSFKAAEARAERLQKRDDVRGLQLHDAAMRHADDQRKLAAANQRIEALEQRLGQHDIVTTADHRVDPETQQYVATRLEREAAESDISGPCSYCGSPDHWRPDCPEIQALHKRQGKPDK